MRFITLAAAIMAALAACRGSDKGSAARTRDLGTGLNTVDRKYGKSAEDVWSAAVAAVKSYDFKIDSDSHDQMGGELLARRAAGEKVSIKVRSIDDRTTHAAVRVEPGNRNMAEMLHEKMAEKLGLGEAKAGLFGGNSLEGKYAAPLQTCVTAAEQTFQELKLSVTQREVKDTWAQLDGRQEDSVPVRIRMNKLEEGTQVTFTAGTDDKALAGRIKGEFERRLNAKQAD